MAANLHHKHHLMSISNNQSSVTKARQLTNKQPITTKLDSKTQLKPNKTHCLNQLKVKQIQTTTYN